MSRAFSLSLLLLLLVSCSRAGRSSRQFVTTRRSQFELGGHPFYVTGFNAYWMQTRACEGVPSRQQISTFLQQASALGLTVVRTWAFNNKEYCALQTKPGVYDRTAFQALDFVVAEAGKYGLKLIMTLSNNLPEYGGKDLYVQWAREAGVQVGYSGGDAFFSDPTIKGYFKNYINTVITRVNTITNVPYRNDPAIMAWELINEPRVESDPSGDLFEAWATEMSGFVKSLDTAHLVSLGMEGFYSQGLTQQRTTPGDYTGRDGTDFIRHNLIPTIDFATVHAYPDYWQGDDEYKLKMMEAWVSEHFEDASSQLKKPVLLEEFGKKGGGAALDRLLMQMYSSVYSSAKDGGAAAGSLVWQMLAQGMPNYNDGFAITIDENSAAGIIADQSRRLSSLNRG